MSKLFEPFVLRGLAIRNRVMMSPMCQYSASEDARATDWHLAHYGARAVGGAGLIIVEATSVEDAGRISPFDLGLYDDSQIEPLSRVVRFCHSQGAKIGVQLAHAGRKAWSDTRGHCQLPGRAGEAIAGPSALAFDEGWQAPEALDSAGLARVARAFVDAAKRAKAAGFDAVELHAAHGYLLNEFLSPLANHRTDEFGGSLANRARFPAAVLDAVRAEWPVDRPILVRLSCSDWAPGGITIEDSVEIARLFQQHGADIIDCSSGGMVSARPPVGPGYQVPFAEAIRRAGVPTIAIGLITEPAQAEEIVASGQADVIALGRQLLREPYWPLRAARELGAEIAWPKQYERAR